MIDDTHRARVRRAGAAPRLRSHPPGGRLFSRRGAFDRLRHMATIVLVAGDADDP